MTSLERAGVTAARKTKKRPLALPAARTIPDVGLGKLLRDAHLAFNKVSRGVLARYDITFSQEQHLRQLWTADGLAQVELSKRVGIETASSTGVIDQLEKRGLICRKRDKTDRRRIIVTLTPGGRALEKQLNECAIAVNARARDGLSEAELATLFDTLQKIIVNLRNSQ